MHAAPFGFQGRVEALHTAKRLMSVSGTSSAMMLADDLREKHVVKSDFESFSCSFCL